MQNHAGELVTCKIYQEAVPIFTVMKTEKFPPHSYLQTHSLRYGSGEGKILKTICSKESAKFIQL